MGARRDAVQLLGWERAPGPPMVRVAGDKWRPGGIDAWFLIGDVLVSVMAEGTPKGVRPTFIQPWRLSQKDARALRERPCLSRLRGHDAGIVLEPDEWAQVDAVALAEALGPATVVDFDLDDNGKVVSVSVGGGPFLPAETMRRALAGPAGPTKTGPKSKVDLDQAVELYVATASVATVAETLGVSTATIYRALDTARDNGMLPQEKKKR